MLTLFKKGKPKGGSVDDRNSSYRESDPMLVWGTAPPAYLDVYHDERDKNELQFNTKSYLIQANLEVISSKPIERTTEMLKVLDVMVDEYDGSYLSKALIITSYLTIGTHLRRMMSSVKNNHKYNNGFTEVIEFTGTAEIHPRDQEIKYNKYLMTSHMGEPVSISYQFSGKKSKRRGKNILDAYNLELGNGSKPPDLKDLLESYEINLCYNLKGEHGFTNLVKS
ncbi:matrix protein M [Bovine ephemeral fever virus]|uniref:Matrix protein n=4 Tax=Bovine ephemeral fever virus TaxID=11303 RepID=MATRX_BEFVB|nr:matrix protein M [Bovine ephemeral fever virus]Q9E785.1 RecName: Full=Matrix protein [Bovine ephemeral fever virus strain BB7721]AAG10412.1 matrix protein M [Bovine ephemeral fever virus]